MHPEYDKFYNYAISVTLTNGAFFVYQQSGEQHRSLEGYLEYMNTDSRQGISPVFIGFYTLSGRYVAVKYSRIRHMRFLFNPKAGSMPESAYDDHFAIRESQRRTDEDWANDIRRHRMHKAEEAGHPDDPMPEEEAEEAEAFLQTMDIDLEAELPGVAITPTTIEADDDVPDMIVYTAYPTNNSMAENELAENSFFYYDQEPGTLYNLDAELEHGDTQRKFLCLYDSDGDLDCIPMDAIWLMEMSPKILDPTELDFGFEDEERDEEEEEDVENEEDNVPDWNTEDEEPHEKKKSKPGKDEDFELPF
jgi:hypothetical protein